MGNLKHSIFLLDDGFCKLLDLNLGLKFLLFEKDNKMPLLPISTVQKVAEMMKDANKNFQCDGFACEFQQALEQRNVAFQGQVLVLRRTSPQMNDKQARLLDLAMGSDGTTYPPTVDGHVNKTDPNYVPAKRRVLPKIILNEPSHELHDQVVGNESHFWTEVACDDGKTYCFDNNHINGVEKSAFYASLDFVLERYRPEDGSRNDSKQTYYNDAEHEFSARQDIVANGQVVIAPLSVEQQRGLASNITDWKTFPNKLTNAVSVDEDVLRPVPVVGAEVLQDSTNALRQSAQQSRNTEVEVESQSSVRLV